MWLYFPVDLTGNVNMTEKFVLGGTGIGWDGNFKVESDVALLPSWFNWFLQPTLATAAYYQLWLVT